MYDLGYNFNAVLTEIFTAIINFALWFADPARWMWLFGWMK